MQLVYVRFLLQVAQLQYQEPIQHQLRSNLYCLPTPEIIYIEVIKLFDTNFRNWFIALQGCYTKVVTFINSSGKLIGIVCLAVAGFHILGLGLTCLLANCINKWKYETIL